MFQITHNKLDQNTWDAFVLEHGPQSGPFLQSFGWGEFVKSTGEVIDRISWTDNNRVQAIAQVIRRKLPGFGSYAYIPRGPISLSLPAKGEYEGVSNRSDLFVRIEPVSLPQGQETVSILKTRDLQPSHTLITNLDSSEKQLLANMHEKTRYNVRLAEKKGVQIEIGTTTIDEVWSVFEMTSSRDEFRLHGKEYYRKMLQYTNAFLAVAKHDGEILAANILIDFGKTRTYLHGASSNVKRNFMAPYLLQWELMKDAKIHGMKSYDWWGVAPVHAPSTHEWAGISRFKRGFGGDEVSYPGTFDVVLRPIKYKLYQFARMLRRGGK